MVAHGHNGVNDAFVESFFVFLKVIDMLFNSDNAQFKNVFRLELCELFDICYDVGE